MGTYTAEQVQKYMHIYSSVLTASHGTALRDGSLRNKGDFKYFRGILQSAKEVPEELRDENFRGGVSRLEEALKEHALTLSFD